MSLDCWIKHLFFISWYLNYITAVASKGYLGVTSGSNVCCKQLTISPLDSANPWKGNVLDIRVKRLVTSMSSERSCSMIQVDLK